MKGWTTLRARARALIARVMREVIDDDPLERYEIPFVNPRPEARRWPTLNGHVPPLLAIEIPPSIVPCLSCGRELTLDEQCDDVLVCPECRGAIDAWHWARSTA